MNEVFVDIRKENQWIRKYFDTDFVSIDRLLACIEDLDGEIEHQKEIIRELNTDDKPTAEEWADYWMNVGMNRAKGEE